MDLGSTKDRTEIDHINLGLVIPATVWYDIFSHFSKSELMSFDKSNFFLGYSALDNIHVGHLKPIDDLYEQFINILRQYDYNEREEQIETNEVLDRLEKDIIEYKDFNEFEPYKDLIKNIPYDIIESFRDIIFKQATREDINLGEDIDKEIIAELVSYANSNDIFGFPFYDIVIDGWSDSWIDDIIEGFEIVNTVIDNVLSRRADSLLAAKANLDTRLALANLDNQN